MRISSRLVAETHEHLAGFIKPGISTADIDREVETFITEHGGIPAFKGLYGFPASACISVEEEVVHGIPKKDRILREGDIVTVDIGVLQNGYYGDSAYTFPVGQISAEKRKLLQVTWESLHKGIEQAHAKNRLTDISHAIQVHAEKHGFSVVRELVGHGIGKDLHEDPQVPNFGAPGKGPRLKKGFALAIEPMINMGDMAVRTLSDDWTVVTVDGKPSAHFEHTIVISEDGPEILTKHHLSPIG